MSNPLIGKTEDGKEYFKNDLIYDLETYPSHFTFAAVFASGKGMRVYEISDHKNDTEEMLEFMRNIAKNKFRMVGFNNNGFDYPVLHYILEKSREAKKRGSALKISAGEIYRHVQKMFEEKKDSRFGSAIRKDDVILEQVDLFLINHFDNKARSTSLKMLEFNMRSRNIEDLPFPVGQYLTNAQGQVLMTYNKHDVMETLKFYYECMDGIKMRYDLSKQFGFDCTNFNDTKIGKELFVRRLEDAKPGVCYKMVKKGPKMVRQMQQTKRNSIKLGECVLPYVKFERPEFQAIHKWFMEKTITETKGSLTDIEEHNLGDVAKYAKMKTKMKKMNCPEQGSKNKRYVPTPEHVAELMAEHPCGWVEMVELKSPKGAASYWFCYNIAETLNVVIDGFQYDFGTGGIHGAERGVHLSINGKQIYTYDVASYYPNLSIKNKLFPQHLDVLFCTVYETLYKERKSYDKKHAANKALKLALNGTYGASNDQFSPMLDPKFTMSITINGQLLLCMLMEQMINRLNAKVIMCNTDGFEFIAEKADHDQIKSLVADWEKLTGLEMEGELYSKMLVRDVNNYLAIKQDKESK